MFKKKKDNIEKSSPDRYGDLAIRVKNQQRVIFSLLIIITFFLMIFGMMSFKNNTKVYIVEKEGNNYTYFGYVNDLTRTTYSPNDDSIIFFINNFVNKARFLSSDLVLYKKNQKELGYFLNSKSINKLDYILNEEYNYPDLIKKSYVVDVEIISTLRATKDTFQVRWREKIYDQAGRMLNDRSMVGLFKYEIKDPTSKEAIISNPLGLLITDISISTEK